MSIHILLTGTTLNIFGQFSQRFLNYFADYTMLRDVGRRITSVEELIASNEHDKEIIRQMSSNGATEMNLLTQLYEQFTRYRDDVNKYEPLKTNYLVKAMIETISYDVLAVDPRTNKTFDITIDKRYPKSNVANQIVNTFRRSTQLDKYIAKILFDGYFYGQYFVQYIRDKKGHIVGLKDTYQPGSVFTISLEGLNASPMYYKLATDKVNHIEMLDNKEIVCLDMQSDRYRLSLNPMNVSLQSRDAIIAQNGSLGRPFCFEIYDKLTALEMLEQLDLASINASLQRNSLVSVTAPDGLDLEQLKEFTAWYEKAINNTGGDTVTSYNLDTIKMYAAEATKLRVIPQQSQRGSIAASLGASENASVEGLPDRINNLRNLILDIKAIPAEFIFTGRDETKVGGALRKYARYARVVKAGQASLNEFITRIVTDLLKSYGHDVTGNVVVSQYCAINTSELDRLEYADASATVISNVYNVLTTIIADPKIAPYVDEKAYVAYVESLLDGLAGASQIINIEVNGADAKSRVDGKVSLKQQTPIKQTD